MAGARRFTVEILGDAKGGRKAIKDTDDALGKLSVTGRASAAGLRVVGTGLKGLAVAATATAVVGVGALIGFGKSVVQIGTQYQDSLNSMQAVTHATNAEMQKVAQTSRDLGNDLTLPATSAADAANAMVELAKGNLTADQAMSAAKGTLQLAAAAQIDGAHAATIQADALNAFGIKASQAGHVADVLANAANAATGEISDFALGMQASSAVAHQYGISLDNTVTALALFANAGIKGSDAGTSLKTALIAMAHPSAQAAAAFKTLGVHAFDAKGNFVGLSEVSGQLAKAQGRMTDQAFAAATATAFGSDAMRAAAVLANAGSVGFDKMATSIGRQGGAAQVAQARTKGLGGAIAGFQSQVETFKIDIFTREAPHLETFIRLLSDRLPGAADVALRKLDGLTGWVESEIPAAKAAVEKFGPAVQTWVSGKLQLAGAAASQVAAPALRAVGNILGDLLPKAQGAGQAIDGVLRSGIEAAGKAARSFEQQSGGLGDSLGDIASSVGNLAHDALPILNVGLTAASATFSALMQSSAGAIRILSPLAPELLATAAAVKGVQLATAGFTSAKTAIGKVTDAYGKMADSASFAAGRVSETAAKALGKDLNAAGEVGAKAMTGVRAGLTALGVAAPIAGVALLGIGYAVEQNRQQFAALVTNLTNVNDMLRRGGQGALNAQAALSALNGEVVRLNSAGGIAGSVGGKLADGLSQAKAASDAAYNSLSVLEQRSVDVTRTQNDLSLAIQTYGVDSDQATAAAGRYQVALGAQKIAQDQLNTATQTGADKINALVDAVDALSSAQLQAKLADVQAQQGLESAASAQVAYASAVAQFGRNSTQARTAQLGLTSATLLAEQGAKGAAEQARAYALANNHSGDAAEHARAGAVAYRAELTRLAGQLAPGSPVRQYIQGLINALGSIPSSKRITILYNTDTTQYHPPVGVPVAQRAVGGPVTAGMPYIVGEHRPELFVPDQSGVIIPRVPTSAGVSGGGGSAGGNTYNITVQVAPGTHPGETGSAIVQMIREYEKRSGAGWRS